MAISCLSLVSFYGAYLRRCLTSAGLKSQIIDIDGDTTIHFWGPNSTTDTPIIKPSLILLHGFGPHGVWQWRPQIASFAAKFNLYIPDLVFFGESTTKSVERSEVFQAETIVKLMEKVGVEKYAVVGTSYGGFVAYRMGTMWPERVEKVVIASSGVNLVRKDNEEVLKRANVDKIEDVLLPKTANQLRTLVSLAVFRRSYIPDFLLNDIIDKLYCENRVEKLELLKGLILGREDTVNITPLQQEVLIIWGKNDKIFLCEKATELKEIVGKNVRMEVIENASHMPQIDQPAHFNTILHNFLSDIPHPSPTRA